MMKIYETGKKKVRNVAGAVFTDGKSVMVQKRGSYSKVGEKYGFWGGAIEEGETKEKAIRRELEEELGLVPKKLKYLGLFPYVIEEEGKYKGLKVNQYMFLAPITLELENAKVSEGSGLIKLSLEEVIRGEGFAKGSTKFLSLLKKKKRTLF